MFSYSNKQEIDHRTIKLIIGLIALGLASITSFFTAGTIESISESYHRGGWAQTFFVGLLFAIAAFMAAYNGSSRGEMLMSKVAGISALMVALFPCKCEPQNAALALNTCGTQSMAFPNLHVIGAGTMFAVLAWFCFLFYTRAKAKGHTEARRRAAIYLVCGVVIIASMALIGYDGAMNRSISNAIPRFVYYGEKAGLIAFGFSWLTASRIIRGITSAEERFSPFS